MVWLNISTVCGREEGNGAELPGSSNSPNLKRLRVRENEGGGNRIVV